MFCTSCGAKIQDHSTQCPNCGQAIAGKTQPTPVVQVTAPYAVREQPIAPQKKKLGTGAVIGIVIGAVVLISVMISTVFGNSGTDGSAGAGSASDTVTESDTVPADSNTPLGQAATVDGLAVQIDKVQEAGSIPSLSGYMEYTPEDGAKYVILNITVKNTAESAKSFFFSDFQLYTADGAHYAPGGALLADHFFSTESLNPAIQKSGRVAFQVPKDLDPSTCMVKFSPYLSLKSNTFNLK